MVIFSRIRKKQQVCAKGGQKVVVQARIEEVEVGQTSDDVVSRGDVPLFSAKSNTECATYQEHFVIHLPSLPLSLPFSFFSRTTQFNRVHQNSSLACHLEFSIMGKRWEERNVQEENREGDGKRWKERINLSKNLKDIRITERA